MSGWLRKNLAEVVLGGEAEVGHKKETCLSLPCHCWRGGVGRMSVLLKLEKGWPSPACRLSWLALKVQKSSYQTFNLKCSQFGRLPWGKQKASANLLWKSATSTEACKIPTENVSRGVSSQSEITKAVKEFTSMRSRASRNSSR